MTTSKPDTQLRDCLIVVFGKLKGRALFEKHTRGCKKAALTRPVYTHKHNSDDPLAFDVEREKQLLEQWGFVKKQRQI